ncbi:hypothetical protein D9M68_100030 [compost metagenome]
MDCVALILEHRPDATMTTVDGHSTPLHLAVKLGHAQIVSTLLAYDMTPRYIVDVQEQSPLALASAILNNFASFRVDMEKQGRHIGPQSAYDECLGQLLSGAGEK